MRLVVSVFAVAMEDIIAVECIVFFERFLRPKAVVVDGQWLLLAVS